MENARCSLKNLADEAQVTTGTVSRALRNLSGVSQETRQRIVRLAEKHNYVPNRLARALSMGKTNLIGLVTPSELHWTIPFESMALIHALAREHGKQVVHLSLDNGDCVALARIAVEQHWDGVILSPYSSQVYDDLRKWRSTIRIPIVVLDNTTPTPGIDAVTYDRAHGVRTILNHVAQHGVRTVGVIGSPVELVDLANSRKYANLENELAMRGMKLVFTKVMEVIDNCSWGPQFFNAAYMATEQVLAKPCEADLIMGSNDLVAFGVISCLKDHGMRVPDDVAVTGYDDTEYAQYARPAVTTVRRPAEEMVHLAWSILERRLAGDTGSPKNAVLLPSLVVRNSTDKSAV